MQQMQEPEGRSYNEGYLESAEYPGYQDDEQAGWSHPQYESQQKLRPESKANLSTINYVMAILSVVASSLIMSFSIALFVLIVNIFARTIGAGVTDIFPGGLIITSFVISLILLLFSIAGFVFSTIQLAIMQKKLKRAKGAANPERG